MGREGGTDGGTSVLVEGGRDERRTEGQRDARARWRDGEKDDGQRDARASRGRERETDGRRDACARWREGLRDGRTDRGTEGRPW